MPEYLPTKQKYVVGEAVKKVSWNKINPQTIKKDSLWAKMDEKNFQNKAFFSTIKENFATKSAPGMYLLTIETISQLIIYSNFVVKAHADSDTESSSSTTTITKKTKEFRVLDPRVGQNCGLLILFHVSFHFNSKFLLAIMFSQLKSTPQQFRQWVLACDGEHLTSDLLAQLDKLLPTPEELKKLSELKNEINDLPDSEQYFCAVSLYFSHNKEHLKIFLYKIGQRYKTFTSAY